MDTVDLYPACLAAVRLTQVDSSSSFSQNISLSSYSNQVTRVIRVKLNLFADTFDDLLKRAVGRCLLAPDAPFYRVLVTDFANMGLEVAIHFTFEIGEYRASFVLDPGWVYPVQPTYIDLSVALCSWFLCPATLETSEGHSCQRICLFLSFYIEAHYFGENLPPAIDLLNQAALFQFKQGSVVLKSVPFCHFRYCLLMQRESRLCFWVLIEPGNAHQFRVRQSKP